MLDASALIALLHKEPGAEVVEGVVGDAAISTVNWSEVCQRRLAFGLELEGFRGRVQVLGLQLVPFTADDAELAADLRDRTRPRGLSLADRACLALATRLRRPALTADRSWLELDLGIEIHAIR